MKVVVVFILAFVALAAAERDWNRLFRKHLKVPFNDRRIPHEPSTRIINGNEAVPHSRPWQVAIFRAGKLHCGGSLIDELNVLTSGKCLDGYGNITVVFGAHDITEDEDTQVEVECSDYVQHGDYNSFVYISDVGLILLPSPVTFNEYIQPIPLDNDSCDDDYVGEEANLSGWGLPSEESIDFSPVLREVTMPVISNRECHEYYNDLALPGLTSICTDTTGAKTGCSGDIGGPLVLDGEQIGIASSTAGRGCEIGYPVIFARACKFNHWIEQNKKKS